MEVGVKPPKTLDPTFPRMQLTHVFYSTLLFLVKKKIKKSNIFHTNYIKQLFFSVRTAFKKMITILIFFFSW